MITPQSIVLNTELTEMVGGFRVKDLIGREIAPIIPVRAIAGQSFTFWLKKPNDRLLVPDAKVSKTGQVNQAAYGYTQDSAILADYGLKSRLPNPLMRLNEAQPPQVLQVPLNVRRDFSMENAAAIWRGHESDVATTVLSIASYDASHYKDYTPAANQLGIFDDDNYDQIQSVQLAIDSCFSGANTLVFGLYAWRAFQRRAKVVNAIKALAGSRQALGNRVNEAEVAEYFGVERVIVGETKFNTAAQDATPTIVRPWAIDCAALNVQPAPSSPDVPYTGFCATFFGDLLGTGPLFVAENILASGEFGLYGGIELVVGHTRVLKVINNTEGFLMKGVCRSPSVLY